MDKERLNLLSLMFRQLYGVEPEAVSVLPQSGSYRSYCRFKSGDISVIGAYNADKKENDAFLSFTESFKNAGVNVPDIYASDLNNDIYLLEDLGHTTLFDYVNGKPYNDNIKKLYELSLGGLTDLQLKGKSCIDYSKCYPRSAFDGDSMMWDLNYFKYYFLKLVRIPFDEQALEVDFRTFANYLLGENSDYFLYRDFQSANIMIKDSKPYFIDYQGGRRGALQYDVASLLFDAKAKLPKDARKDLVEYYYNEVSSKIELKKDVFMAFYQGFVLIRLMQAMGAFGFRGMVEKKPGFMESIPPALKMFDDILSEWELPVKIPELKSAYKRMLESDYLNDLLQGLE